MNGTGFRIRESYYYCKKKGVGDYYSNCKGIEISILYKVFLCDDDCCPQRCEFCLQQEKKQPIQEGFANIVLGEGRLFDFIENALLNNEIRRNSSIVFVLCPEDAFEDRGVPNTVPPNCPICIYLEEPAI